MEGDRNSLEERSRPTAQSSRPRQHRVTHRGRNPVFLSSEDFGDEERITDGLPIELAGIDVMRRGELGDSRARQRLDFEADDRLGRGQLAQHDLQRMRAIELVVAVTREDRAGAVSMRRASKRTTSNVAQPPVQVPSGRNRRLGLELRSGAEVMSCGRAPDSTRRSSSPPVASATSRNGPRGRGVKRASHAPQSTRGPSQLSQNARMSEVQAPPASPATSTSRPPWPVVTSARTAESREVARTLEQFAQPRTDDGSMLPQLCASVAPVMMLRPAYRFKPLCASVN